MLTYIILVLVLLFIGFLLKILPILFNRPAEYNRGNDLLLSAEEREEYQNELKVQLSQNTVDSSLYYSYPSGLGSIPTSMPRSVSSVLRRDNSQEAEVVSGSNAIRTSMTSFV